ncbi:hypothetical protein RFI_16424, partial [Reticulomyxa filosa]
LKAYVIKDKSKKLIKMEELTFKELLRQSYHCLETNDFQKINDENLKLQLVDMKDNIIRSDEDLKREFKPCESTFKICWVPVQPMIGKTKIIKNALVVMIAISEYTDNTKWHNLPNVKKKDIKNFTKLFKQELKYKFVCNKEAKMNKEDVNEFLANLTVTHKLHKNEKKYDALIMIISGHGDKGDVLVTSDGKNMSINNIRTSFNSDEMESLKNCPKIFIIDACRGEHIPQPPKNTRTRGVIEKDKSYIHNDNGFFMLWSTTKGYRVYDSSLFSKHVKCTIISKYKSGYSLHQMIKEIRKKIKRVAGAHYCVESQDTVDYDIAFKKNLFPATNRSFLTFFLI